METPETKAAEGMPDFIGPLRRVWRRHATDHYNNRAVRVGVDPLAATNE